MSNWNKVFKPIVVLVVICVIVTGALAATNSVTAPIIEEATIAAENAARTELLPEADGFTQVEGVEVENVSAIYTADNGVGTVITSSAKGYGGDVVVMVAFNPDGTIKQIKVTEQAETKGIGSNVVTTPSIWARTTAACRRPALWSWTRDVDAVTGATISSTAVNQRGERRHRRLQRDSLKGR